jgi:hypothetical protein
MGILESVVACLIEDTDAEDAVIEIVDESLLGLTVGSAVAVDICLVLLHRVWDKEKTNRDVEVVNVDGFTDVMVGADALEVLVVELVLNNVDVVNKADIFHLAVEMPEAAWEDVEVGSLIERTLMVVDDSA